MSKPRWDLLRYGQWIAIGILPALLTSAASAKTWEINNGAALSAALTNSVAGDRIYIHQGEAVQHYVAPPGGWKITKPLEIFGDGPGVPYARISPGAPKCTWLQPASATDDVLVIDMSGWPAEQPFENLYIHDLFIGRDTKSSGSGRGIYFTGIPR